MPVTHSLRPAAVEDGAAAAELLLGLPDGLADMFARGEVARRVARAAFEGPSTMLSHRRALVAEDGGAVVGMVVRFPGPQWAALRRRTAATMLRAAGVRHGPILVWRGSILDRLIPAMPPGAMYVPALSVAPGHRGRGAGSALLGRVIDEAIGLGLRVVALDVGARNPGAIRLYSRLGFEVVSEQRIRPSRGWAELASLRMELPLSGRE
jgi:ribosomal protein S18 acetylase RimI-like enzyme